MTPTFEPSHPSPQSGAPSHAVCSASAPPHRSWTCRGAPTLEVTRWTYTRAACWRACAPRAATACAPWSCSCRRRRRCGPSTWRAAASCTRWAGWSWTRCIGSHLHPSSQRRVQHACTFAAFCLLAHHSRVPSWPHIPLNTSSCCPLPRPRRRWCWWPTTSSPPTSRTAASCAPSRSDAGAPLAGCCCVGLRGHTA